MSVLRGCWRLMHLLLLLLAANLDGRLISRPSKGVEGAIWIHHWCRRFVAAIGLTYQIEGLPPEGGAIVSNHMSYLDVLLYSACRPFVMVAKREVESWPLLGWLTARAGTVYVERLEDAVTGRPRQTHTEVNARMAEAYASGLPVLFFPEGTTNDGSSTLPFRRGLFHSVLAGAVPVRTAALHFALTQENGRATVAEHVCFTGDALLVPHLFRCLGLRGLRATVRFKDEVLAGSDRFALASNAQAAVQVLYSELLDRQTDLFEKLRRGGNSTRALTVVGSWMKQKLME